MRKNFIPLNEGFICQQCGYRAASARGTFRNHCPECLTSKHVDQDIPGDRLATCQGLMPAMKVEGVDPDKLDLVHVCVKCGKTIRNKVASDDNKNAIWKILEQY